MTALKVIGLLLSGWGICLAGSLLGSFTLMVLTEKKGGAYTGNLMMVFLGLFALVYLGTLPLIFLVLGRWVESLLGRLALVAGQFLLLAGTWFLFAFGLVVMLNR